MFSRKVYAGVSFGLIATILLAGCTSSDDNNNTPVPSGTSTPAPNASGEPAPVASPTDPYVDSNGVVNILTTDQYNLPQETYGQFIVPGENTVSPVYINPAYYTADKYITSAFNSKYLFSGEWQKDKYSFDWANDAKLYNYFSKDYSKKYEATLAAAAASNNSADIQNLVYTPDPGYTILPECNVNAETMDSCAFPPYQIIGASSVYNSDQDVQLTIQVQVNPIYQKPDTPEGNSISQKRVYTLNFKLAYTNPPTSKDTKTPIMLITDMSSSLEILEVQDYMTNQS